MARNNDRGGTSRRSPKDAGRRLKKKPCQLCTDRMDWFDYTDVNLPRKYMSDRGKIRARRVSGNCAQHQREIALAIKTARELVLLPYTQRTTTERPGGRGGRGGGQGGRGGRRFDADAESGPAARPAAPAAASGNGAPADDGAPVEIEEVVAVVEIESDGGSGDETGAAVVAAAEEG